MNRAERRREERFKERQQVGLTERRTTAIVGFCYAQSTMTPQWRRSLNQLYMRDAHTTRRILGELAHEASGVHVPTARSKIVADFLEHPLRPDWLWFVDTDATFADWTLDALIAVADPVSRPIVGGLSFGVAPRKNEHGVELFNEQLACPLDLFPTLYRFGDDGNTYRLDDYPRDELVQVHATGAHCLLIHRTVLEHEGWRDGHPLPWFRTAVRNGQEVSEDQFFCTKAGALGFPIFVHTGIPTGHVKTFVADEAMYLEQMAARAS